MAFSSLQVSCVSWPMHVENLSFKNLILPEGLKGIYCLLEWKEYDRASLKKLASPETAGFVQKYSPSPTALWARDSHADLNSLKPCSYSHCLPSHLNHFILPYYLPSYSHSCFTSTDVLPFTLSHSSESSNLTLPLESHFREVTELRPLFINQ